MKFLSVFVCALFYSVTLAYPDQTNQSFSSAQVKNLRSGDGIQNQYIRHGNTQNDEPVPVSAGNDPSTYLNTQNIHISKSEPPTVQYGHRIGPGFPYQNPQDLRNEVQRKNPAILRRELSPRGPAMRHIMSNPKLRAFYAALKPTTQYTIIHPNGTIEHTNEIHSVAARHPNYVMVKANDILANIDHANNNSGNSNAPPLHSVQSILTKSSILASQGNHNQQYASSANANAVPLKQAGYQPQSKQEDLKLPGSELQKPPTKVQPPIFTDRENAVAANPLPVYPIQSSPITTVSDKDYVYVAAASATSSSASPPKQHRVIKLKNNEQDIIYSPPVIESIKEASVTPIFVGTITDTKEKQSYPDNVPIQPNSTPTKTLNQIEIAPIVLTKVSSQEPLTEVEMPSPVDKLDETAKNNANIINITQDTINKSVNLNKSKCSATPPKQHSVIKPRNKDQDVIYNPTVIKSIKEASVIPTLDHTLNNNKEQQLFSANLTKSTTTQQIPSQVETVPIILPAEPSQKTLTEVEMPSPAPQDKNNKDANQATLFEIKDGSEKNNNTNKIITSGINTITTDNTNIVKEDVTNTGIETLNQTSSVVDDSSNTSSEVPWTWFSFSDETFWEVIRNNSNNIYFFFMPPKPKVSKEIKTTIFPNGTTIEEITETVLDYATTTTKKLRLLLMENQKRQKQLEYYKKLKGKGNRKCQIIL